MSTHSNNMLRRALASEQSHLIFEDPRLGTLRNFAVKAIWTEPSEARHCTHSDKTVQWDDQVAVTNDVAILRYLSHIGQGIPGFPRAGDRPACFFDPRGLRVGIVNAGGPAAGLNVVNDSITKRHFQMHGDQGGAAGRILVLGYLGGFQGLAKNHKRALVPSQSLQQHYAKHGESLVTDDHALGAVTMLKSSRFDVRNITNMHAVLEGIRRDELDVLYVVGGNGSQTAALEIKNKLQQGKKPYRGRRGNELVVIGAPKTMDNDLLFADTTFGFTTTVDHLVDAIRVFHNTVECLDRVGIMQVFGAASGFVAHYAAYCSGEVDYVIIPEVVEKAGICALLDPKLAAKCLELARFMGIELAIKEVDVTQAHEAVCRAGIQIVIEHAISQIVSRLEKKKHALVIVAEGAKGIFKHEGKTTEAMSFKAMVEQFETRLNATRLRKRLSGDSVRVSALEPQYLIRDHPPRSYDIALCKFMGKAMVDAALAGYTDCIVTRWCGQYALVPLQLATALTSQLDPGDYFYRTMTTRYRQLLTTSVARRIWRQINKKGS